MPKTNKRSGEMKCWTYGNHAMALYSPEMIESRMKYIHENPMRSGLVKLPENQLYSSVGNPSKVSKG